MFIHPDATTVLDIFLPRIDRYNHILEGLMGAYYKHSEQPKEDWDGRGLCGIVSNTVCLALKHGGNKSRVVMGLYKSEVDTSYSSTKVESTGHAWIDLIQPDGQYSADMVHHQTGSQDMVVIIPSSLESLFNLDRGWVARSSTKDHTKHSKFFNPEFGIKLKELYELFNSPLV